MTIAITGAGGQLGRLTVEAVLKRGVAPSEVVAIVRDPAKGADFAAKGVQVRAANYTDPAALETALAGVDRLLLVSSSEIGQRVPQHRNVIDAAKKAGVSLFVYTSLLRADSTPLGLGSEHAATEQALTESGIPAVLLRNGWYWENYTGSLAPVLEHGVLLGAAKDGRVAAAARADYAEAAAVVLTTDGHAGAVYELSGDEHLTHSDLAAQIAAVSGKPVGYQDVSPSDYAAALVQAGLPDFVAEMLADSDAGTAAGGLDGDSGDLQKLIGRASTPFAEAVRAALA